MFNQEQRQYLEDVLGLNPNGMVLAGELAEAASPESASPHTHYELLVLTFQLDGDERTLLTKILSSIQLGNFVHLEQNEISLADFPPGISAAQVLAFSNYPPGKNVFADSVWTVLPPVAQMMGANAEVVSRKKEAWALLQQFAKERK